MAVNNQSIIQQEWFRTCPVGILVLNAEGRVCGVNPELEKLIGLGAAHLLGHTRESLPSPAHKDLFEPDTQVHLHGAGLPERWLQCLRRELVDQGGESLALHYYQDLTEVRRMGQENELLRQRVDELAVTDELTGMANRRALMQMLTAQVSRSRRYQNALSLGLVEIVLSDDQAAEEAGVPDALVLSVSCYLRDRLRWADVIGRWDESRFMLMLPETPADAAHRLIDNLAQDVSEIVGSEETEGLAFQLHFGLAEWHKGFDVRRLVQQVEAALVGKEAIIASPGV